MRGNDQSIGNEPTLPNPEQHFRSFNSQSDLQYGTIDTNPMFQALLSGYEEQMRKYESDIRNHISVILALFNTFQIEQQLKIYIENVKYK